MRFKALSNALQVVVTPFTYEIQTKRYIDFGISNESGLSIE